MNTFFAQATAAAPAAQQTTVSAAPAATTAAAPAAQTTTTQPAPAPGAAPQPQQSGSLNMLVPMLLIFAIFYFMMIRPQQRKEKERRKMIDELRAGATVLFAGGFIGKIVEAKEKTFKVEIAGDVVVEIARASVQNVVDAAN